MPFISTKTYNHEVGLSCCFRQWRAQSHCSKYHGYSLAIKFEFEADELDERGWVVDFGGLKPLKKWLEDMFDHKLLVAHDDPMKPLIMQLSIARIADVVEVDATGCEQFARIIFDYTQIWMKNNNYSPRCKLRSVEVREHGANSAIYMGKK